MLRILATIAPSTAASTSASSKTRNGALPPSSMLTRWSWSADWRISTRPIAGRAGEADLAQPVVGLQGLADLRRRGGWCTTLSTPSGSPASASTAASASIVSGVCAAGLTTIVQPAATRRPDLAGAHREREVPRRHEQARPDRLLEREQPAAAGRRLHPATVDPHRLLGVPAEELRAVRHLALGLGHRLAHLQAHQRGEVVGAVGDHLEGAAQDLAAFARRRPRPVGLGGHGRVEGRIASAGEPSATSVMTEPSAGSTTSNRAPPSASRQVPPMNRPRCSGARRSSALVWPVVCPVMGPALHRGRCRKQRTGGVSRGILRMSISEGALSSTRTPC